MCPLPDGRGSSFEVRLDELQRNLTEVIDMLLEDGEPELESEFIGTQKVYVA